MYWDNVITKCSLPMVYCPLWIFDNWDSQGYLQVQRSCWHNSSWCSLTFFGEVLHLWRRQAFKLYQDYFLWYLFSFHKLHTSYYTTTSLILQTITLQMVFLLFIQAVSLLLCSPKMQGHMHKSIFHATVPWQVF